MQVLVTECRTEDLPVAERFGSWHDVMADALTPSVFRSDHESDFRASARVLELGGVQVSALAYPSLENGRPAKLIRRSDPESYQLMLNVRGGHGIRQGGRDAISGPGEVTLYGTARQLWPTPWPSSVPWRLLL
ncbi:hypothetical protein [Streptomyces sp. NPDC026673]|uniref:AraC-like ligand-binding domain-containing protein n=1 Tax=Streptomyces sp. NPDC026673 TaxID=3155724 RepID=UPI0033D167C4